eukprot:3542365-Pyramimonas_sp.AAC.1
MRTCADAQTLAAELHKRMPPDTEYPRQLEFALGVQVAVGRRTLAVYENETVGDAVAAFAAAHHVAQAGRLALMKTVAARLTARQVRQSASQGGQFTTRGGSSPLRGAVHAHEDSHRPLGATQPPSNSKHYSIEIIIYQVYWNKDLLTVLGKDSRPIAGRD